MNTNILFPFWLREEDFPTVQALNSKIEITNETIINTCNSVLVFSTRGLWR